MSTMLTGFCRLLLQSMLVISILFLLRGHNHPGGGFIAALIAVAAIALHIITFGRTPKILNKICFFAIVMGILCLIVSLLSPLINQHAIFTGAWLTLNIASNQLKLGTPLLFDIGVYLCILGSVTWFTIELEQT